MHPVIFQIGGFKANSYGLMIAIGVMIAMIVMEIAMATAMVIVVIIMMKNN